MGSASQVVGSFPHGEVFAAPVFHQVHQEQLAGGEIPENWVENPVVQKQVIVQASPHLPPVAEFTSAGDTAENSAIFPVVQKQVLVGERLAPLSEVAGPQAAVTVGYVAAAVSRLTPVVMEQGPAHDNSTSAWLLARSLEERQQYEEEVRHDLEVERLQVEQLEAERRLRVALEEFRDSPSRPSWSSCSPVTKAAVLWYAAQNRVEKKMKEGGGYGGREPG